MISMVRVFYSAHYYNNSVLIRSKIEVPRDVRNSKRSVDMASSGKNDLNIRTNASPKWDRNRCPEE